MIESKPIMLTADMVVGIHDRQIKLFGGLSGCTRQGISKLKYAVYAPSAAMGGVEFYPSIESKAAILMTTIVRDHPFLDGNKRTGLLCALTFLYLNGYNCDFDDQEAIDITLALASGEIDQEEVTDWIEKIIIR